MDQLERERIGQKTSIIGLISNLVLAVIKIILGAGIFSFAQSASLLADGVNNASDSLNSILSIVAFKLSNKRPNRTHPFGYQRIEYIFSLIMSILIIVVGVELAKDGVTSIISGADKLEVSIIVIAMIIFSILVKIFQYLLYKIVGKKINSMELKVLSKDSFMDVIVTTSILVSTLIYFFTDSKVNIDSYLSIAVSLVIIYNGVRLSLSAINPLIGIVPDKDKILNIIKDIKAYPNVINTHDTVVHSYGNSKVFITIHIEISDTMSFEEAHAIADKIEIDIKNKYNVEILTHLDPINTTDPIILKINEIITTAIKTINIGDLQFHEVRIVNPFTTTKKVVFDLTIDPNIKLSYAAICDLLNKEFSKGDFTFNAVINCEENYFE